jgi:hypothetical protein
VDWVFGIVFLVFILSACIYLFRSADQNQKMMASLPKNTRILRGVFAFLASLGLGLSAVTLTARFKSVSQMDFAPKIMLFGAMLGFVLMQTYAAMLFISIATQKRDLPKGD